MKGLTKIFLISAYLFTLNSCASVSHITDDDVYVTKNPQLVNTEEVNDVSSYENYRFRRDRGDFITRYRINSTFTHPTNIAYLHIVCGTYSPFNDPHYYTPNGTLFLVNGFQFGNYDTYYNPFFGSYGYYNYGYQYYNPYGMNNSYGNSNSWNNNATSTVNYNYHKGPRNSISGVNSNQNRGFSTQKTGIAKKPNSNFKGDIASAQNTAISRKVVNNQSVSDGFSKTRSSTSSRAVSAGSGLSRNSTNVSTTSRREVNSSREAIGTRDKSITHSSSGRSSTIGSSTIAPRGGNSGNVASPRTGGGSGSSGASSGRRGGN